MQPDRAAGRLYQFHGRSSWNWLCGVPAMRPRTSASQACGSTSLSLAVPMSVYIAAARTPPRSEPQNSHDFLPRAIPRSALSLSVTVRPGSARPWLPGCAEAANGHCGRKPCGSTLEPHPLVGRFHGVTEGIRPGNPSVTP